MALAIRQHFQNAPLFYRHALLSEPRVQLSIDFSVRLSKEIREMFSDGFAGRSSQEFELCNGDFG